MAHYFAFTFTPDCQPTGCVQAWLFCPFQAGLAGYSDAAMRIIARRQGAPFCVTEALLDRTILAGGRGFAKADLGELHDNVPGGEEDHPLAGQTLHFEVTIQRVRNATREELSHGHVHGAHGHHH